MNSRFANISFIFIYEGRSVWLLFFHIREMVRIVANSFYITHCLKLGHLKITVAYLHVVLDFK